MTTILSSEWYKLLHGRVLALILACCAAETLVQVLSSYSTGDNEILGQGGIWVPAGKSFILIIWFAAFAGFFVATEFQNGTMRNALALGKNRTHVYLSKLVTVCIAVVSIYAVDTLVASAGLGLAFGFGDMAPGEYIRFLSWNFGMQVLFHLSYAALFSMFAFISRNTGVTILLGIGYMIAAQVAVAFLGNYPGGVLQFAVQLFPEYYISAFRKLSGNPAFITKGVAVCAAYFTVAGITGCLIFRKSDIK